MIESFSVLDGPKKSTHGCCVVTQSNASLKPPFALSFLLPLVLLLIFPLVGARADDDDVEAGENPEPPSKTTEPEAEAEGTTEILFSALL